MSSLRAISLCLLFVAALARADHLFDPVRAFIREQIAARDLPSVTVAVAQHGKIVWEEGFGWADRERRIAATPDTLYSLASINKPFTCTALMTLVQAGKIDLDRPANDYLRAAKLRSFAFDVRGATVRRLANHTSGLPTYVHFYFTDGKPPIPPPDAMLTKYGVLIAPPGEHYQYSNVGMQALGTIGTRATGLSYADYMERTVFRPLGLTHTAVGVPAALAALEAVRYDETGKPLPFYDSDHPATGAIYASAHDLVRFGMFHLKDHLADQVPILTDASLDAMHEPSAEIAPGLRYAVGWTVEDQPDGIRKLFHGGGQPGVSTALWLVPAEDLAIVVLLNAATFDAGKIAERIGQALVPHWVLQPPSTDPPATKLQPTKDLAGVWTGSIRTHEKTLQVSLRIRLDGDAQLTIAHKPCPWLKPPQQKDGWLLGDAAGDLQTKDGRERRAHQVHLELKQRGDQLNGGVWARSNEMPPALLPAWIELTKAPAR